VYLWALGEFILFLIFAFTDAARPPDSPAKIGVVPILAVLILAPTLWWLWYYRSKRRAVARRLMKPTCCKEGYAANLSKEWSDVWLTMDNEAFVEHLRRLNPHVQIETLG
jgi:hypothetical protein